MCSLSSGPPQVHHPVGGDGERRRQEQRTRDRRPKDPPIYKSP